MGTEPEDAALWIGYWPLLSLILADAAGELSNSLRAISKLFLDAAK